MIKRNPKSRDGSLRAGRVGPLAVVSTTVVQRMGAGLPIAGLLPRPACVGSSLVVVKPGRAPARRRHGPRRAAFSVAGEGTLPAAVASLHGEAR